MTLKELYKSCVCSLSFSDDAEFESLCLFEDLLSVNKNKILFDESEVSSDCINILNTAIERRKNGEPLQYILGKWYFYDLTFDVGEGVLIPRPETELLVDFALNSLKDVNNPVIFDLCAGTGCIGLTIAHHRKDATVYLLEKENKALEFLNINKNNLNLNNVRIINDDLFTVDLNIFPQADLILSNPPYIKSSEIEGLQKEVLFEPVSALDGGKDGLDFYKCLAKRWVGKIKKNRFIAMECGDNQSNDIIEIFKGYYKENNIIFDFNNIDRIVIFRI